MRFVLFILMGLCLIGFVQGAFANSSPTKEVTLFLKGDSLYPLSVGYRIQTKNQVYAIGRVNKLRTYQHYMIAVNRVPKNKPVKVSITYMRVSTGRRQITEFNDPCEITLKPSALTAYIHVGVTGNQNTTHAGFVCTVSSTHFLGFRDSHKNTKSEEK